jgi:hypothetical protein
MGVTGGDNQVVVMATPESHEADYAEEVTYADLAATLRKRTRPRNADAEADVAPRGNDVIGS